MDGSTQISLQYALDNGMIDIATIQDQIRMRKREQYLAKHTIWQGKNGFWYVKIEGKLLKKKTKEAVEEEVISYEEKLIENPTVKEVFWQFLEQKSDYKEISESTYDRYTRDYDRFFRGKEIEKMRFGDLTEEYLTDFVKRTIASQELTAKGYANLKTILRGMLLYAKGKYTLISANALFSDMQFSKSTFKKKIVSKENEVYLEEEIPQVIHYLKEKNGINHLGILLAFYTGVRVGELAAIKKTDIIREDGSMYIHIQRTETKYKKDGVWVTTVKEYPKSSAGDRYIVCPKAAEETIGGILKLNPDGEYLFEEDGKRMYEQTFANTITWMCKALKIPQRSMHKIRKTYGTTLIDAGVDESVIIEQMGHSDINCTKQYYYFSNKGRDKKRDQIMRAIVFS